MLTLNSFTQNFTFFLIKPESCCQAHIIPVLKLLAENNIFVESMKTVIPNLSHWQQHYIEHKDKPFYDDLCNEMSGGAVIAMKLYTFDDEPCWQKVRRLLGCTDPAKAELGTIRQLYGRSVRANVAHASDSDDSVQRELRLWNLE